MHTHNYTHTQLQTHHIYTTRNNRLAAAQLPNKNSPFRMYVLGAIMKPCDSILTRASTVKKPVKQ